MLRRISPALVVPASLFVLTLVLFGLSFKNYFIGGVSFEFSHYAEISRNILEGNGYSTRAFYPGSLALLERAGASVDPTAPVVDRFPLPAYWGAFWMGLTGADDLGMALSTAVAHAIWVVLVFWAGRWLFGAAAGGVAAFLWAVHPVMLVGYDLRGYADVPFGAVFCALNVLYFRALTEPGPARRWFGVGALMGLAFLARQSFVIWLPVYLGLPFLIRGSGRKGAWRAAAAFLAIAGAWTAIEYPKTQLLSPPVGIWNLSEGTLLKGELPWMEYRVWNWSDFADGPALLAVASKMYYNFNAFSRDVASLWFLHWLFPLAVVGAVTLGGRASLFAGLLGALFLWEMFAFSVLRYENLGYLSGRYYLWAGPFTLLYASAFLLERAKADRRWRWAAAALALVVAQTYIGALRSVPQDTQHSSGLEISKWPELEYVREHVPQDEWIVSNIPTQIAWYTRRASYNVTNKPEDLAAMAERWPAKYLLLSNHWIGELYNFPRWERVLRGQTGETPEAVLERIGGWTVEERFGSAVLFKKTK